VSRRASGRSSSSPTTRPPLYARAITAGAEAVEPPKFLEQFSVTIAFVKDPDGYLLELGQQHAR